jgi:16S rRNA (uracil1498-N3)-methyltransferase
MTLPFFHIPDYEHDGKQLLLDESTSRHIVQVLRMKEGEQLHLTDGKGILFTAAITKADKKKCIVKVLESQSSPGPGKKFSIGISLLKNTNRFEWFLEKVTEIGIYEIIPLLCDRTEKQHFRFERMNQICISAMLQSKQTWLPKLHQPISFELFFRQEELNSIEKKFIAHCEQGEERPALRSYAPFSSSLILIGPEGDFTIPEINLALQHQFLPVNLGNTRLRTETAGVAAAVMLAQL